MFPARGSFVKQIMLYRSDSSYHNERQLTLRKEAFCHMSLKNVITIQRDIPVENVQALYAFPFSSVRFFHGPLRKEVFLHVLDFLKNVITNKRGIPVLNVQLLYACPFSSVRFIHCTLKEDLSPGPNECKSLTEFHYLRNWVVFWCFRLILRSYGLPGFRTSGLCTSWPLNFD